MPSSPPSDRYEPLPGLFGLPAFLWRKLSPSGRRRAVVLGLATIFMVAAAIALLVPAAREANREDSAREALRARTAAAARRARLVREGRPRSGRGPAADGLQGQTAQSARRALIAAVDASVLAHARGGAAKPGAYRSATCTRYPAGLDPRSPADVPDLRVVRLECLAVSSVARGDEDARGSLLGQPYRVRVDFATGRYAWCPIVGRPGEGAINRQKPVPVARACGGDA